MKYLSKKEFLEHCNLDKEIRPLIESGYIDKVNDTTLKEYGIRPKMDGFYYYSNILELSGHLSKSIKLKHGKVAFTKAISKIKEKSEHYEALSVIKLIETESPNVKRFLLATLSSGFNNEVKLIRNKYGIPDEGFDLIKKKDIFEEWVKKMTKKAEEELADKTYADYVLENKSSGYIFGEKDNYSDNIFTSIGKFKNEAVKLFWKYNIREGFIPTIYVKFGLNNKMLVSYLNQLNNVVPFQISNKLTISEGDSTRIKWANPKKFGIFIDRPVTKDALIEYIEKSKNLINSIDEYYNDIELNENIQRDWLIYQYNSLGFKQIDIPVMLEEYGFYNVTKGTVKTTLSRLRDRISEFEKVTQ